MCNKIASPPCERNDVKDVCRYLSLWRSRNGFHIKCFMRSFWLLSTLYNCERWCHPNVHFWDFNFGACLLLIVLNPLWLVANILNMLHCRRTNAKHHGDVKTVLCCLY